MDILIADDFDAVTPKIEEVQEPARQQLDFGVSERLAHRLLVIDPVITRLFAAFLKGKELVAKIDEGGVLALCRAAECE